MILIEYLSYLQDNYEIKKSNIEGVGVFSKKYFPKGAFINNCVEPMQTFDNGISRINRITYFGKYLNHSYNPTAEIKIVGPNHSVFALKDIKPGDEITVDYTKTEQFLQPEWWWK